MLDLGFVGSNFDTDGSATMFTTRAGSLGHSVYLSYTKFPDLAYMVRRVLGHCDIYPIMDNSTNPPTWRANRIRFVSRPAALRFFVQIHRFITRRLGEFQALLPRLLLRTNFKLEAFLEYARDTTTDPGLEPFRAYDPNDNYLVNV